MAGVIIAIHLAGRGLSPTGIGLVLGAGVLGTATGTIVAGLRADRWGRRRTLLLISLLSAVGYVGVAFVPGLASLIGVALIGLVNGMGRDRGPASTLDQAIIPSIVPDARRTWTMAWYNASIDAGHALGALGGIVPTVLERTTGASSSTAHAWAFVLCGVVVALSGLVYLGLGRRVEVDLSDAGSKDPAYVRRAEDPAYVPRATDPATHVERVPIDPATRAIVHRLSALFAVDSIGGGFLNSALVAYWFFERYGTSEVQLAGLFFAARVLNVVSHLVAAWLARRIGLLNTMVMTHLPSSVLLMLAPTAPTAALAAALFLAREALVEMDVPTRQSYVMAVVPPSARTYASGMTNVTRNIGWGVGPLIGGSLMQHLTLAAPLFIGGTLKIAYDLALYRSFKAIRPPEER